MILIGLFSMPVHVLGQAALWQTINPELLLSKLQQNPSLLLLDIRDRASYEQASLPGTVFAGSNPHGYLPDAKGGEVVLVTKARPDLQQLTAWSLRLKDFHFQVYLLGGGVEKWQQQGRPIVRHLQSYVIPGTVPFVIPRGLCEANEPAQEYH